MTTIEPLDDELVEEVTKRHPVYRRRLAQIVADESHHGDWKVLETWPLEYRGRAVSARRSLTDRYGKDAAQAGYEFATVTRLNTVTLTVRYDPKLIVKEGER